jgi:HK97 family phage major capsid protein
MKYKEILAKITEKAKAQQALVDKAKAEKREGLDDGEIKQFEDLQKEIDTLKKQAEIAKKLEENEKYLDEPADPAVIPATTDTQGEKLDDGGFKSIGELMHAVKYGDSKGRLKDLSSGDVGVLIPPAFSQNILKLSPEEEIVMPKATIIPAGSPPDAPFIIPYLQQGSDGVMGGVQLNWTGEGKAVQDVGDPEIKDLTLTPQELSGYSTINNKTLQNWEACGGFIQTTLRQGVIGNRDYKFLRGSGSGCPLGVLNAPGKIAIKRDTAATVKYIDAANMLGRFLPEALSGAIWVASISILPTIVTLVDGAGRLIFVQGDATKGVPSTLLGIPIKWTGKVPTLGNEGDLMLVNFNYYLIKPGSGPFIAISEHIKFLNNKTVFKIVANLDGQPWVKDPLKLEDGATTVSPYVTLK